MQGIEGRTIDRYVIGPRLGAGGFGAVHRARHSILGTEVALKLLAPQHAGNQEVVQRFLREAKAAASAGSPHIVTVFDAGVVEGQPFLAMELLDGEDLEARIARDGALAMDEAADVVMQVLEGLHAAHERGIVHRDMKPANVFLIRRAGRPFVKLVDFGISKISEPAQRKLTQTGAIMGTPAYIAPEQLANMREVDGRADVYAVAVMLFEALTGRLPYAADTLADVLARLAGAAPVPLHQYLPNAPTELAHVIARGLEVDPARRWESAAEMARALAAARGASPVATATVTRDLASPPALAEAAPESRTRSASFGPPAPSWQPAQGAPPTAASYPPMTASHSAPASFAPPASQAPPFVAQASGSPPGLWIALAALAVVLPLACVGGALITTAISRRSSSEPVAIPEPAAPPRIAPSPVPPPVALPRIDPPPRPVAPVDGPLTAAPVPPGADACTVPVHQETQCDRAWDRQLPSECRAGASELHVLGAYNPRPHDGHVDVDVARTVAPLVLVLHAFDETEWRLRVAPGVRIERVIAAGYQPSRVVGLPEGIPLEESFYIPSYRSDWPPQGWSWEGLTPAWAGRAVVARAERETGLTLRSYAGCYAPSRFLIGQGSI